MKYENQDQASPQNAQHALEVPQDKGLISLGCNLADLVINASIRYQTS
jgi:hypothetical protein